MKISVIIPCYNVEHFVQKCTESILVQKGFELELLLVNDGSTDGTSQVLEQLAKHDERITLITQSNAGLSAARNAGIAAATGDYLMFVDADDWLEENTFEVVGQRFTDEDLFCFSYYRVFNHQKKPRDLNLEGVFDASYIQRRMVGLLGEELRDPSQADSLVTAWGKLYKTALVKDNHVRFTDTQIIGTEDALFNIQYLEYASRVCLINLPLYNYYKVHQASLTKLYKPYLFSQWKTLYSKINTLVHPKAHPFKEALSNRIALSIIGLGLNETFSGMPIWAKAKKISIILHDDAYIKAYQNLDFRYFPLHWKLFFYLAKSKNALGIVIMSELISKILNKK